ncbi:O-antigen polymerase [Phocaeicola sp.]
MTNELGNIIVNSMLYILLALYYIRKRGIDIATVPLILWAFSSVATIYYYSSEYRSHQFEDKITLLPFFYLFALVWLSFLPLVRYDYKRIKIIAVNNSIFNGISWLIILLSSAVLFQNTKYFISNMFDPGAYLEQYVDKMNGIDLEVLTGISQSIMRYCKYLKGLIPVFLIYSFTPFVKTSKMLKIGLFASVLNLFINYMNCASRFALLTDLFLMVFLYLLLYRFFHAKVKKIVNMIGLSMGGVLVFAIFLISAQRFGEDSGYSKTIDYSISLYAGESFINFNGDMWNMPKYADGDNCFAYFKDKWRGKEHCGRDFLELEKKVNRRMNVYYTFIGDYYTDVGRYWTILIVVILSLLLCVYMRARVEVRLGDVLILATYVKILLLGITYWTYLNYTLELVVNIIIAVFLNMTAYKKFNFYDFNRNGYL